MSGTVPYLIASVVLSAGRNILSKMTAASANDNAGFYFSQTVLFLAAALLLATLNIAALTAVSGITLIYGIIYGVLLILSQWMYTKSLKSGYTCVCSVIYSLGFILPTLSGALFWNEKFTALNFCGLLVALSVIALTFKKDDAAAKGKGFIPYILIAMLSSGGLGIMQKVQQTSPAAQEKEAFLVIAFTVAFAGSLVAFILCRQRVKPTACEILYPALTGLSFGGANLFNTVLAGAMKSAVFFPVQNISTILLTTVLGVLLFRERLSIKTCLIIALGIVTVVIFSI